MNTLYKNSLSKTQETILAQISHDLKNPIVSSLLALSLLSDKKYSPLNSYQKELLENMTNCMKYMKDLIANILDSYRFSNRVYSINKVSVDFNKFVDAVIYDCKYIFLDKSQTIKITCELTNPFVELDFIQIKRVINNLISNASKYAPQNSQIEIKLFEKDNCVYFSIENSGKGISDTKNIFDKFITCNDDKSLTTGLGLYIVKEIITTHKGNIFIESKPNKFTRITFCIPRK